MWCNQHNPHGALNVHYFFDITKLANWSRTSLQPERVPGHVTPAGSVLRREAGCRDPTILWRGHPLTLPEPQRGHGIRPGPGSGRDGSLGLGSQGIRPWQSTWTRMWAYLNHHAAPDVVPPDGDPPVGVILLRVFDGLAIPAAAYFPIS